ncbi:MAG: hypothetical protein ACI3VN_06510 [Candidatus Onthomonas sp.]
MCFETGEVRLCDFDTLRRELPALAVLEDSEQFAQVEIEANGRELVWPGCCRISEEKLAVLGERLALNREDLVLFCQNQLVSTAEAAEMLHCTRQNIDSLVRRARLHPVKCYAKNKVFLKSDILRRMWDLS